MINTVKCPERYQVIQFNVRNPILSDDEIVKGENHILIENQQFCDCYENECVAWDKERKMCKKIGGNG